MGLIKPCSVSQSPNNSGVDCKVKMSAPSLILMAPADAKWTDDDEADFLTFVTTKIHAALPDRWYPLFGLNFPIRTINDGKESDVTVTYDDGSIGFIRNGTFTRTLMTNEGGLKFAKTLISFNKFKKYGLIEIDLFNNVNRKRNTDKSLSPIKLNTAYATANELAGLKTEFQSGFVVNFTVEEYINRGEIMASEESLIDLMGLIDAEFTQAAAPTATVIALGVRTTGAQTDLVAAYPAIASLTAIKITDKITGAVVTPTAIAIEAGHLKITGVYTSGKTYVITGTGAAALFTLNVEGYEITGGIEVTIP